MFKILRGTAVLMAAASFSYPETAFGSSGNLIEPQKIHCHLAEKFTVSVLLRAFNGPVEVVFDGPDFACKDPAQQDGALVWLEDDSAKLNYGYRLYPALPLQDDVSSFVTKPKTDPVAPKPLGNPGGTPPACICLPETLTVLDNELKKQGISIYDLYDKDQFVPFFEAEIWTEGLKFDGNLTLDQQIDPTILTDPSLWVTPSWQEQQNRLPSDTFQVPARPTPFNQ